MVIALIKNGCPSSLLDHDQRTPLHISACHGNVEITQMLLQCPDVKINTRDFDGCTALILAASLGHTDVVKLLVAAGCDLDERNSEHATALIESTSMGHYDVVQLLLQAGCHVNVMDSHGWAALSYAAFLGSEALTLLLLEGGADVNAQDMHGRTALHEAVYYGYPGVAKVLMDSGCRLNVRDQDGYTQLFLAAWDPRDRHMEDVVVWMCQLGANPNIPDYQGMLPVYKAWSKKRNLLSLIQHGCCLKVHCQSYGLLELATMENNLVLAAFLLAAGCDPSQVRFDTVDARFTASFAILKQLCMVPLSLREQCRLAIRRQAGVPGLHSKILQLPLPQIMLKYLCITDVTVSDLWPNE